jgi:hypothetical protein
VADEGGVAGGAAGLDLDPDALPVGAEGRQAGAHGRRGVGQDGEQEVLGAEVAVAEAAGLLLRADDDGAGLGGEAGERALVGGGRGPPGMGGGPRLDGLAPPDAPSRELGIGGGEVGPLKELVHPLAGEPQHGGDLGDTEQVLGHGSEHDGAIVDRQAPVVSRQRSGSSREIRRRRRFRRGRLV